MNIDYVRTNLLYLYDCLYSTSQVSHGWSTPPPHSPFSTALRSYRIHPIAHLVGSGTWQQQCGSQPCNHHAREPGDLLVLRPLVCPPSAALLLLLLPRPYFTLLVLVLKWPHGHLRSSDHPLHRRLGRIRQGVPENTNHRDPLEATRRKTE